ncbi:MAG TPA: DUF3089 domain-containing protein [Chitinophagaceae bacterium]
MHFNRFNPLVFLIFLLCSCNRYKPFEKQYNFKSSTSAPDYADLDYWAAHPRKWDPSDSIPQPLRNETSDSTVDVFFLHPTTLTKKKNRKQRNARIDDASINAKTDYSTILYQASVFNQQCRVFAPRYRQAHLRNFFIKDTATAQAAFKLAYEDIKTAFEYYMKYYNQGRPIIIAAHSQGSMMAEKLLKDFFDAPVSTVQSSLNNKLVVAYLAGWPIPKTYFSYLKMCEDSLQTGCLCGWRTFRKGYVPYYLKNENGNSYVTNPLSWNTTGVYAPKKMNKGSVLTKFNKIYSNTTDAQISNGFLYVSKPQFPGSFLYLSKNYHIGDINLYYLNIRENVKQRISAFWKQ